MAIRRPLVNLSGQLAELPVGDTLAGAGSGGGVTVSDTAPSSPTQGSEWTDTNTGIKYTWVVDGDSAQWVELGPSLGAASAAISTVLLNVPEQALGYSEVVVLDAAVSTTTTVLATLVGELDAENDIEELSDSDMRVFAVAETGQIRFVLTGNGPFTGVFKVNYQLMA